MKRTIGRYFRTSSDWLIEIPAILTFALGVINIISAVGRPLPSRVMAIRSIFSVDVLVFSRGFVLVTGLLLMILAYQLAQRSRTAWILSVSLISASIMAHLTKGFDVEEATFAAIVLLVLVVTRKEYRVKHQLQNIQSSLKNIFVFGAGVFIFGILGFFFLDQRYFGVSFQLGDSITHWSHLFFGFGDATLTPHTRFAWLFMYVITLSGVATLIYAFYSLFRPAYYLSSERPRDLARAEDLIAKYGHDSLDNFKIDSDKEFFFSESGQAMIAFRQVRGFALALSDPVAKDIKDGKKAIAEFISFTADNGLSPAFVQAGSDYLKDYAKLDFNRMIMGEEAVVDLDHFTLDGPAGKEARYYLNRFAKEGFSFQTYPELSTGLFQKLKQVNDEWLTIPHYVERTFTEGHLDIKTLEKEAIFTVEDSGGAVICFATVVEYPKSGLALLDLLRRRADVPNGAMDFLVYNLEGYFQEKNFRQFDLSLAPLSGIPKEATIPEKTLKFAYKNLNELYRFTGLRKFKDKFRPNWSPRYLVYQSNISLPFLIYAVLSATSLKKYRNKR